MPNNYSTGLESILNAGAHHYYRQTMGSSIEDASSFAGGVSGNQASAYGNVMGQTEDVRNYLQGVLGEGAVPAGAMGNIQRTLGRVTNRNINTIREGSAQSGFRGVVDPNAVNDVYANEEGALGNAELDLMKMQYARKSDAVANLLGITNMGVGALGQDRQTQLSMFNSLQGSGAQAMAQRDERDAQPSAFGQIAGGLLTTAGTLATAGVFSDKNLKEKIVYTGETHDGLPVADFNYIGSPARYRGFIAQDVEDQRPDCVTTFEDGRGNQIMTVNYQKLGFEFRRVG